MISKAQAHALIESAEYRDWKIGVINPEAFAVSLYDMMRLVTIEGRNRVPVMITYTAPNADEGIQGTVSIPVAISLPLTETEAEFARALYEAIAVIEDHERREFFRIGHGSIDGRRVEKGSRAIFHPHGVRRTAMFHDLDGFAERVRIESVADNSPVTADAVA